MEKNSDDKVSLKDFKTVVCGMGYNERTLFYERFSHNLTKAVSMPWDLAIKSERKKHKSCDDILFCEYLINEINRFVSLYSSVHRVISCDPDAMDNIVDEISEVIKEHDKEFKNIESGVELAFNEAILDVSGLVSSVENIKPK